MPITSGMVAAPTGLGGREEAVAVADGIEMILLWWQQSISHQPIGFQISHSLLLFSHRLLLLSLSLLRSHSLTRTLMTLGCQMPGTSDV